MALDARSAAIFLECARRGSLGRAAGALNLSQPAVTRTLKVLEGGYGVPLFERTTRGVVPTAYGEALLPYAQLIVSELANAGAVIEQMRGASRGVVRVGGVGSVVGGFIIDAIGHARRTHPGIQFQIVEELEDRLLDQLKDGDIDIAVSPEPYVDDDIMLATPDMLHDTVSAFAAARHPLAGRREVALEQVAACDWALPPIDTPVVREWLRRFHAAGLEPNMPSVVSRSVHVIKSAVASGDMLCWMPLPLVAAEAARGELVRIDVSRLDWTRSFRIHRRKRGLMSPSAAVLLQSMRKLVAQGSPG